MRMVVMDKPCILADIWVILRDEADSAESFIQRVTSSTGSVLVGIGALEANHEVMYRAVDKIARTPTIKRSRHVSSQSKTKG
jgi:hypothetical protein